MSSSVTQQLTPRLAPPTPPQMPRLAPPRAPLLALPPPPALRIKVPVYISEEILIKQLQWLETKEARRVMSEPERIAERRVVTEKFKTVLSFKESWLGAR
jgi:hypothetical protein